MNGIAVAAAAETTDGSLQAIPATTVRLPTPTGQLPQTPGVTVAWNATDGSKREVPGEEEEDGAAKNQRLADGMLQENTGGC